MFGNDDPFEMMTRSTIEKRLELRQDDPDAMKLNAIVVNGGKELLGERLLALLSQSRHIVSW